MEAQGEFLVLVEDATRKPDISKSVQRFQLTTDEAKVRLDLAHSKGTWLMPSNLLLNTQSMVVWVSLKKASSDMKLGVNRSVNLEVKSVGVGKNEWGLIKDQQAEVRRIQAQRGTFQVFGQAAWRQAPGEQVSKRHPSNEINKTSAEVQVRTPPRLYETNHDIVRYD